MEVFCSTAAAVADWEFLDGLNQNRITSLGHKKMNSHFKLIHLREASNTCLA